MPTEGDWTYTVTSDNTAEITGYSGRAQYLSIPSTLGSYPVRSIGDNAFEGNEYINQITNWGNITSIGSFAFKACSVLLYISELPDTVTDIDPAAFAQSYITSFSVSEGNMNYSSRDGVLFDKSGTTLKAYPGGKSSTTYTIPDGTTSIGNYAFYGNHYLNSVSIPNSVTSIGEYAFALCYLHSISIPDSVTTIGKYAFNGCDRLGGTYDFVIIGDSVVSIGQNAFSNCTVLKSIVIPNSVTTIGDDAFSGCIHLTTINIGESVDYIGYHAFYSCYGVEHITFTGPRPTTLGEDSFRFGMSSNPATVTVSSPATTSSSGWASGVINISPYNTANQYTTYTFNTAIQQQYKLLRYKNYKIQTDSAIRDGNGVRIDTHYAVHAEYTESVNTSREYIKYFSTLTSLGGKTPRIVQVYDASGKEILTDVTIDLTNECIKIWPTLVSPSQTWTIRVTAW